MKTRKIKVYISGPISGMPDWNRPAFDRMKRHLLEAGLEPVSPLDGIPSTEKEKPYVEYMTRALQLLDTCDAIVQLSGWDYSYGAQIEKLFAVRERKIFLHERHTGLFEEY